MSRRKVKNENEVEDVIRESEKNTKHLPVMERRTDIPALKDWKPKPEDYYFTFQNDSVVANFSLAVGQFQSELCTFHIKKRHYLKRIYDILFHANYYVVFYDTDKEFFLSLMSVKYLVDKFPDMEQNAVKELIVNRICTDQFCQRMLHMANDLYTVDINTDSENRYSATPKISNDQAKVILALSFAIRVVLPLCLHYVDVNIEIVNSKEYIQCFDKIFMGMLKRFEENGVPIYNPMAKFILYRLERSFQANGIICDKKKQLYGITFEYVFEKMMHDSIMVKSLYKLSYDRSIVSYIDGVFAKSYNHFRVENFKYKPVEIDADTGGGESDDYLTHAESIEMQMYRIDESSSIINDVNNEEVANSILDRFGALVTDEEYQFYLENIQLNELMQMLLHQFYSGYFHNSQAIWTISKELSIKLIIILKKYLQHTGMIFLPQICTAIVQGRFKENTIKNAKFKEKFESSDIYTNTIMEKYRYVFELSKKENLLTKEISVIINSVFQIVDPDPELNGRILSDIPVDRIILEYEQFLSIVK